MHFQVSVLLLHILLIAPFRGLAQDINNPTKTKIISTKILTINDGLSQGMINAIMQDKHGFLWFATKDGLNKYDGYSFKIFRHIPGDANSICENHVTSIFEDSHGNIWLGTANGLIDKLEIDTETFKHFNYRVDKNSLMEVFAFTELKDGSILGQSNKIFKINPLSENVEELRHDPGTEAAMLLSNQLLVTMKGNTLKFNNLTTGTIKEKDIEKEITSIKNKGEIKIYNTIYISRWPYLHNAYYDSTNRLIHLVFSSFLLSLDAESLQTRILLPTNKIITSLLPISKGMLLINLEGKIYEVNTEKQTQSEVKSRDNSYLENNATFLWKDRTGIIWIGTNGYGVLRYNPQNELFNFTPSQSTSSISNIGESILVGHVPDLYLFNEQSRGWMDTLGPTASQRFGYSRTGHPPAIDESGQYWTSEGKEIIQIDPVNRQQKRYYISSLVESFRDIVHCITFDKKEFVWIGTETGLIRLNPKDSSYTVYKNDPNDSNSLSSSCIYSLTLDQKDPYNILWVGTNGGGLNKLDLTSFKAIDYSTRDGLPNNVIYGILQENTGALWLSTNNGLSRFDPDRQTINNYTINDGLQSNEFNRYSYAKSKDGYFFFGGINGLNYFRPEDIRTKNIPPLLAITDLYVGNKPLRELDSTLNIPGVLYSGKEITLPYRRNLFTIHFAALDFTATHENRYKYRLVGFSNEWVNLGTANSATFTNLDPGEYTFYVIACNKYGIWNNTGATLKINILPPWYMTWWFRVLAIAFMWLIAFMIYRYRLNSAIKVYTIRNEIARDLHDEIGANLSNIAIFSNVAAKKENNPGTMDLLKKISNYAQYSSASLQDIVWMISPKNDSTSETITRMKLYAKDVFDSLECKLNFHIDDSVSNLKLSLDERKNFYLLFKEGINNIAKHSSCTEAEISISRHGNLVRLQLKDNGKGIDQHANGGNGLTNLKNRADELGGEIHFYTVKGGGTLIDLSFNPRN
ncbi:MAG: two-component regulator propeller domain-containing protein [Chitinophagaceae bacterium]